MDGIGLVPVLGILKNADEVGDLGRAALRHGDEASGAVKHTDKVVEGAGKGLPKTTAESVNTKLDTYLLEPTHPTGGSKANWFKQALGFDKNNASVLAEQIKFDPKTAVQTATTEFGTKFSQTIPIKGINGRVIDIEFVWIRNNDGIVRLVTSIPTKR